MGLELIKGSQRSDNFQGQKETSTYDLLCLHNPYLIYVSSKAFGKYFQVILMNSTASMYIVIVQVKMSNLIGIKIKEKRVKQIEQEVWSVWEAKNFLPRAGN